jgi:protein O-mannosyl-transferase
MAKKPTITKPAPLKTISNNTKKESKKNSFWEASGWITPLLIAMAITAILYLPTLSFDYVNWDDDPNITENENLTYVDAQSIKNIFSLDKGNVIGNYNPLPILTFAIEKKIMGKFSPGFTHGINLLLHLLTMLFVMRLLQHLGISKWGSFVGTLLFGIHPMRIESVAWATERKDVLFAMFFFAALMYYVRWIKTEDEGKKRKYYFLMIVLAALSCLSKVQAVTLPLSMLLLDYWFNRPVFDLKSFFSRVIEKTPFWVFSLLTGLANIYTLKVQGSTDDTVTKFNFGQKLLVGAYSFCVYLVKLVVPYQMSPLYPYPQTLPILSYFAPIGFFAVMGLVYWLWKKGTGKEWIFGILFFFFNVMFVLQVFAAGQGFIADRFTYVPYFGFFFIAGFVYDKLNREQTAPKWLNPVLGIAFALCAFLSFKQIKIWQNGETLWTKVIEVEGKGISLPYGNRGQIYRKTGNFDKSIADYSQAIAISPDKPEHYNSRGKTHFDMAMTAKFKNRTPELTQKAIEDYNRGLNIANIPVKTRSEMLANRGAALASTGKFEPAIKDLTESLSLQADNKNAYLNRSLAYFSLSQYDKAIIDHTKLLEYDPKNANIYYERGMCKRILGDYEGGSIDLSKCIQLNPSEKFAYIERSRCYSQINKLDLARQDAQQGVKMGGSLSAPELQKLGL